jgi:hypothetical protein
VRCAQKPLVPNPSAAQHRTANRTIVENNNACFIVRDKNGQGLGYFYFEEEPARRAAANLLSRDEARRLGVNFAKLPELLQREE